MRATTQFHAEVNLAKEIRGRRLATSCAERSTLRSMKDLIEIPRGTCTADCEVIKVSEGRVGEINRVVFAAHTLIDNGRCSGLSGR